MTAPLTPIDCDLRAYDWFPFYHKRMRQSAFWKRASDAVCRISVEFWSEAYEQVPAGSLPDDDVQLSEWAGFGRRNLTEWLAIKADVMSAWVLCCDGRWYHPTLCEVALTAWAERQEHLRIREEERRRKEAYRRRKAGLPEDTPPDEGGTSAGQIEMSHGTGLGSPPENALIGTGKGIEGNYIESARAIDRPALDQLEAKLREAAGASLGVAPMLCVVAPILGLLEPGEGPACSLEADVLPAIRASAAKSTPGSVQTWQYFKNAIIRARDQRLAGAGKGDAPVRQKPENWPESRWRQAIQMHAESGDWGASMGPKPGQPGCRAPPHLLADGPMKGHAPPDSLTRDAPITPERTAA